MQDSHEALFAVLCRIIGDVGQGYTIVSPNERKAALPVRSSA